jgi:hypothetical protein
MDGHQFIVTVRTHPMYQLTTKEEAF